MRMGGGGRGTLEHPPRHAPPSLKFYSISCELQFKARIHNLEGVYTLSVGLAPFTLLL